MATRSVHSSSRGSVDSKSSAARLSGEGRRGSFSFPDGQVRTLRASSWVSRLNLKLPPLPPAAQPPIPDGRKLRTPFDHPGATLDVVTIDTDESRTRMSIPNLDSPFVARGYFDLLQRRLTFVPQSQSPLPPPPPQPPHRIVVDCGGNDLLNGFGPFQFRPSSALPRGEPGRLAGSYNGGGRVFVKDDYGEVSGRFPLFRKMAHLGEEFDREREVFGSGNGRKLEPLPPGKKSDNWNFLCPSRRKLDRRSRVSVSPFFNSAHLIDRSRGTRIGSTGILENRNRMRPPRNWDLPLPISFLPPSGVEHLPSCRGFERQFPIDPWRASTSGTGPCDAGGDGMASSVRTSHVRSCCLYLTAGMASSVRTSHKTSANPLDTTVCADNPQKHASQWNMRRFKRTANFDDSLPLKFRKLGGDD
ncbi:uncharacterized protein LOC122043470 isoform X2 [Zingiber officinale]|uniref:uncharacterized protein LOC122043470 isoform X2 n=1 Tax=Zingiber officinale TaxID=94328 RepID=UPI001C4DD1AC|nr:uncharacterized protein LOC122043470 isoform X2 [Zingiber officinale]